VPGALAIQGDAGRDDDVERAFAETRERFGSVDLVVVAISPAAPRGGAVVQAARGALEPYVDDLLPALFTLLRIGGRTLGEQGSGTYVQITGGSARRGMPGRAPWAAAAFATRGMIQATASELRERGVHVALLVVDATIESEKTGPITDRAPNATATEEDVARAVAYLAEQSPRAWTHELQITPAGDRWVP
jgi:NAD(P)-dependent dehydrogenase (short-subunit alcohol dehydrogenase family)